MASYIFLIIIQREIAVISEVLVYTNIPVCLHKRENDMAWAFGGQMVLQALPGGHPLAAVLRGSAQVAGWAEKLRFCLCNECCQEIKGLIGSSWLGTLWNFF